MLGYVEEVLAQDDIHTLWKAHVARMSEFGLTRLIYGFNRANAWDALGDHLDALILTEHDEAYLSSFLGKGLYRDAPMMRWAAENEGASPWSWAEVEARNGRLTKKELEVMALNRKFGVTAGYTIAFPKQSSRLKGVMALSGAPGLTQADVDETWERHGREIEAMNWVVHMRLSTLPHAGARRPLTRRQREVLELIAEGENVAGVAASLGLSVATIEKHLRLARATLDVETTAAAVHKASWQNQIFSAHT